MNTWLKRLLLVVLLLLAFGGVFFLTMPVQFVVGQFGLPDSVRIDHMAGTVRSGRATGIAYRGRIGQLAVKDTRMDLVWAWCPGRGITAMCVRVESPLLKGTATLAYSLFGGEFTVSDAQLSASLRDYPLQLGALKSKLKGVGDVRLEMLSLDPGDAQLLTGLRASGEIRDLQAEKFKLGNYVWRADLGEDGGLTSDFSGGGDRFTIKGQASLDLAERSYRYTADMKTGDSGLQGMLKGMAKRSRGDKLTFSGDGKLNF